MLEEVDEVVSELNRHRPFNEQVGRRLREAFLPDRIVASLNMEHIAATRRQTLAVMDALRINETIGKGEAEIANILRADEFVTDAAADDVSLSARFIRECHGLVAKDVLPSAGAYRTINIELPGAPFDPPSPTSVPAFTDTLVEEFANGEQQHPIVRAAWLHAQFTMIHPFADGNGRTGRLLQDFVLLSSGLMPVGIPPSMRDDYYSALSSADNGNWSPLVELLALLQMNTVRKALAVVQEPEKRAGWIQNIARAAAKSVSDTRHKRYIVWRSRMEGIIQEFHVAARELDEASDVVGAELRDFGVPDFEIWKTVCERGWTNPNWLFSMLFYAGGKPFYKTIAFYRRHRVRPEADTFDRSRDLVSVYFTGVDVESDDRPDFNNYADPHIRLREVTYREGELLVYKQSSGEDGWELVPDLTIQGVVEMMFTDVFAKKAGLGA